MAAPPPVLRFGIAGAGAGRGGPDQLLANMRDDLPGMDCALTALTDPAPEALATAAAVAGLPATSCFSDYVSTSTLHH